ncbi:MAG: hypothetical protein IPJ50_08980 [Betaproteobacteria bacterium]|nr:hypothetical protein [Betaproteobacteria bacterium]
MLGAIIGDIVGSVYEFNNCRSTSFTPFFHPECFFTDDTVCIHDENYPDNSDEMRRN